MNNIDAHCLRLPPTTVQNVRQHIRLYPVDPWRTGLISDPVEQYYGNFSKQVSVLLGADLPEMSLERSRDILQGVERIQFIANHTLEDLTKNLGIVTQEHGIYSDKLYSFNR